MIQFLQHRLITRFGMSTTLVSYNATYFSSLKLIEIVLDKGIILWYSSNYYPQGNDLVESTNKSLIRILERAIVDHQRNWHNALPSTLWVDRVTPKDVDVLVATRGSFHPRWPLLDAENILEARDPLDRCWNTLEKMSTQKNNI